MSDFKLETWDLDCWRAGENWNTEPEPKFTERNFLLLLEAHNELAEYVESLAKPQPKADRAGVIKTQTKDKAELINERKAEGAL